MAVMFQNESEETEGREKKGNRPGVLRCGFCVKQGNVVSAQWLNITTLCLSKNTVHGNCTVVCVSEEELEEAVFHPGWQLSQLLQVWNGEEPDFFLFSCWIACAWLLSLSECVPGPGSPPSYSTEGYPEGSWMPREVGVSQVWIRVRPSHHFVVSPSCCRV